MKIAFLTPEFVTEDNFDGGLANYLSRATVALANRGHEVYIFTLSSKSGSLDYHGVHVIRVMKRNLKNSRTTPFSRIFPLTFSSFINALRIYRSVMKIDKHVHFDLLQNSSYCWPGIFFVFRKKIPVVTRLSSISSVWRKAGKTSNTIDVKLHEFLEILTIQLSNAVYGPSSNLLKILNDNYHIKSDLVLPPYRNSFSDDRDDSTFFKYDLKNKKYALYFGTLSQLKGTDFILSNIDFILRYYDRVVFIGKGSNNFKEYLKHDRLIFIDSLKHSELSAFLMNAALVFIPSRIDNLPNTWLESTSLGKIILASKQTGLSDYIKDGINGFLYEDKASFKKQLRYINGLNSSELSAVSTSTKRTIRLFSISKTIPKLENYFLSAIANSNRDKNASKS